MPIEIRRSNPLTQLAFLAVIATIAAAGAEQGVTNGALSRMLDGMGASTAAGGLLVMMFGIGIVLASFATALLIRPLGDRKVMAVGAILAAAAWAAHALSRSYAAGLPLYFLAGAGHGAMLSGATAAAAESGTSGPDAGEEKRRGRRISLVQGFYMLGLCAGSLAGGYSERINGLTGWFDGSGGWAIAFLASAGFSAVAAILLTVSPGGRSRAGGAAAKQFRLGILREIALLPGMALLAAILFLDICGEAGLGAWLSRHLQKTWQATPVLGGWAVALIYAGIAVGRLLCGWWSPRITLTAALLTAAAGCAALSGLLAFAPPVASLAVAALVGLAIAPVVPYGLAIMRSRCPAELGGAATSAALGTACLGSLTLPPIMGVVAQHSGSYRLAMLLPAAGFAAIVVLAISLGFAQRRNGC